MYLYVLMCQINWKCNIFVEKLKYIMKQVIDMGVFRPNITWIQYSDCKYYAMVWKAILNSSISIYFFLPIWEL